MTRTARASSGLGLVLLAAGCAHGSPPPSSLSDGSPARPPPVPLAGIDGPTVATRVRLVRRGAFEAGTDAARCVGLSGPPAGAVIERVDVRGVSVTYLGQGGRVAYACERGGRALARDAPWCGRAFGKLEDGRLRDPRVSLSCREAGEPLGFAWIQPVAAAAYVVVAHRGYHEVYPVVGDMPVRIATDDVDLEASRATFAVSEHTGDGRRIRDYYLEGAVSG